MIKEKLIRANYLFRKEKFEEARSLYREIINENPKLESILSSNIEFCIKRLSNHEKNKDNYYLIENQNNTEPPANPDDNELILNEDIFITLTTIDSRIEKAKPVIESLQNQTYKPFRIILNLSKDPYLLDKGLDEDNPILKEILRFKNVIVNWVPNIGSYRKIYPFLERHFSQTITSEKIFITVDDDTLYPDYFVEQLYRKYSETKSIVAFRGRCIEIKDNAIAKYDEWSLGQDTTNFRNLPTGKDGIIYSTRFFTRDFLNLEVIKEIAPTVDDLWIKWHCALNGVKSQILNPEACTSDYKSFPVVDYSKEYRGNSLYAMLNSKKAGGNNDIAVERLEKFFTEEYGYGLKFMIEQETKENNATH